MGRNMVTSDILVIGGSGAGVMGAVAASREGAHVALVSKGRVGKSGNAIMLGGSFGVDGRGARDVCGEADANQEYTPESLFEKMVACAFGLGNQELQKRFVEDGPCAVKELLQWVKECKSTFVFSPGALSSFTAAGIVNDNMWKLGLSAFKYSIIIFIIPYTFVYSPAMLGIGPVMELLQASATCLISAYGLSMGLIGVGIAPMKKVERGMAVAAALLLIVPETVTDMAGLLLMAAVLAIQVRNRKMEHGTAG